MAFTPRPIPPTDLVSAEAGPALARLCALRLCDSTVDTSRWLLELLMMRTRGEVTLRAAVFVVRWVLTDQQTGDARFLWSNAALVEVLGQLDATPLTATAVRKLQSDAYQTALGATTGNVRTADVLRRVLAARRAAATTILGPALAGFLPWYDRLYDALVVNLRP